MAKKEEVNKLKSGCLDHLFCVAPLITPQTITCGCKKPGKSTFNVPFSHFEVQHRSEQIIHTITHAGLMFAVYVQLVVLLF